MTIDEIKVKYGIADQNYYIRCGDCPLVDEAWGCPNNCTGYDNAWEAIQKYLTKKEPTKPTKTYEHDGCVDCKYFSKGETDEPCVRCKYTTLVDSYDYRTRPDLFEPEEAHNEDLVNHPSHYTQGGMETIEEMELIFGAKAVIDYCLLNAWKYRARAPYKGNPEQDMDKANWYLNKYKELVERRYGKE